MKAILRYGPIFVVFVGSIFLLHGSRDHLLLSIGCAVVCPVMLFIAWCLKKEGITRNSRATAYLAVLLSCVGLSYVPGGFFYRSQISSTKQKLAAVIVSVENARNLTGAYPARVDELLEQCDLPWLTRKKVVFGSRADFFSIYFRDPNSGLMDVFHYGSDDKTWKYLQR